MTQIFDTARRRGGQYPPDRLAAPDSAATLWDHGPARYASAKTQVAASHRSLRASLRDVIDHRERAVFLEIGVIMRGVGGSHDPSAPGSHANELQPARMSAGPDEPTRRRCHR